MYRSPINLWYGDAVMEQIKDEHDAQIFRAVLQTGITVDRAELIKALKYDRNQYEKGFRDGVESCKETIANLQIHVDRLRNLLNQPFRDCPAGFYIDKEVPDA